MTPEGDAPGVGETLPADALSAAVFGVAAAPPVCRAGTRIVVCDCKWGCDNDDRLLLDPARCGLDGWERLLGTIGWVAGGFGGARGGDAGGGGILLAGAARGDLGSWWVGVGELTKLPEAIGGIGEVGATAGVLGALVGVCMGAATAGCCGTEAMFDAVVTVVVVAAVGASAVGVGSDD